jgi:histidinol dehydrogenase
MQFISTRDANFEAAFTAILEDGRDTTTRVDAAVAAIIQEIRTEGDAALLRPDHALRRLGPRRYHRAAGHGPPKWTRPSPASNPR